MKDGVKARYTLEFKEEAVRLVHGGEKVRAAARQIGRGTRRKVTRGSDDVRTHRPGSELHVSRPVDALRTGAGCSDRREVPGP